ncbi:MAG: putative peptide transporter permease subunit: rane component of superfamily, partial [Chloroflexota bacterium]
MASDIASLDSSSIGREGVTGKVLTPGQLIWRRFRKHRMAVFGMVGFCLLMLFIILGSIYISDERANAVDLQARLSPPDSTNIMGTDSTGRDVFSRIVHGGQISLFV